MLSKNPAFKKACRDLDIKIREFSDGWLLELTYKDQTRYTIGNHLGLNSEVAMLTMRDKVATATLLEAKNIPYVPEKLLSRGPIAVPPVKALADQTLGQSADKALSEPLPEAYPVVLKPNTGERGIDVYLCKTPEDYLKTRENLFEKYPDLALSPYEDAEREYRCFYLNGKIELIYAKIRQPNDWRHNLSNGAKAELIYDGKSTPNTPLVTKPVPVEEIKTLALRAGKALKAGFATIDILEITPSLKAPETPETSEASKLAPTLKVLELNSGVAVKHLLKQHPELLDELADLYKPALLLLFSQPNQNP